MNIKPLWGVLSKPWNELNTTGWGLLKFHPIIPEINPNPHDLLLEFHVNAPCFLPSLTLLREWNSLHFFKSSFRRIFPAISSQVWSLVSHHPPLMTKFRCSGVFGRFRHCLVPVTVKPLTRWTWLPPPKKVAFLKVPEGIFSTLCGHKPNPRKATVPTNSPYDSFPVTTKSSDPFACRCARS